jgi:hypothetical protein
MNSTRRVARHGWPSVAAAIGTLVLVLVATSVAAAPDRPALAYWAFNCFTTCGDANFQPEAVGLSTASMTSSFAPDAGVNQSGTTLNSIPPHEARSALTLRTGTSGINNGRNLTWRVNTTGYTFINVSFAARRSVAGFNSCQFQYTLDGSSFVDFGAPFDAGSGFAVIAFDLRHVKGLNNNPNAGFRIVFNGGSTTDADEFTLIDNLQVTGK